MRGNRRRALHTRLADLERRAAENRSGEEPRALVYLPRKDGDERPLGVLYRSGPAVVVLYDPDRPGAAESRGSLPLPPAGKGRSRPQGCRET